MTTRMKRVTLASSLALVIGFIIWYLSGGRPFYVPADSEYYATTPQEQQALQQAIDHRDLETIRDHGWKLWGSITQLTSQTAQPGAAECGVNSNIAVFDTWYGEEEIYRTPIFCPDGKPCAEGSIPTRYWHTPRQSGGAQLLSFNKYNTEFVDWVNHYKLYDPATLTAWNEQLTADNVATAERSIDRFVEPPAATATMLKPTYWLLKRNQPMMVPYWKGPLSPVSLENTDTPRHPVVETWKNFVLYDPTGKADPTIPRPVVVYGVNGPEKKMVVPDKVVSLEDFYSIPLSEKDVKYIQGANIFTIGGINVKEIEPCDVAVLVGMHVTTAEVKNWVWQTMYWNPFPDDHHQPGVSGPFRNFDMATAYFFNDASGKPHIAYNPYLEPPITGPTFMNPMTMYGADSNCMSCHHAAAFPTMNGDSSPAVMLQGSYIANGEVSGAEQWFENRIKTTFMWSMVMSVQAKTGIGEEKSPVGQQ